MEPTDHLQPRDILTVQLLPDIGGQQFPELKRTSPLIPCTILLGISSSLPAYHVHIALTSSIIGLPASGVAVAIKKLPVLIIDRH